MLEGLLKLIRGCLSLTDLVLGGHFGNHPRLHLARQCGLYLICNLRYDSALYLPCDGPYRRPGPHRKYGEKLFWLDADLRVREADFGPPAPFNLPECTPTHV